MSFGLALDSMGVALVMIENVEQRKLVEKRWIRRERREMSPPQQGKAAPMPIIDRDKPAQVSLVRGRSAVPAPF